MRRRGAVLQCTHEMGLAVYDNAAYDDRLTSKDVPLSHFERDLLFLLHDVARLLRVDADKRARLHGMTRAQWGILIWLERQPGISQKELAELLEVEPITVARLIDRLELRGMVERRPDPQGPPYLAPAFAGAGAAGAARNLPPTRRDDPYGRPRHRRRDAGHHDRGTAADESQPSPERRSTRSDGPRSTPEAATREAV